MYPVITFGSEIQIPTYIFLISLIYTGELFWLIYRGNKFGFERNQVLDVARAIMVGGFVGARLTHVIWEEPSYYLVHPVEVFYFWQGGFVFFGGLLAAIGSGLLKLRHQKENWNRWLDVFAPLVALGYALGRLACLAAGCCFGRKTNVPWCIVFPYGSEAPSGICLHPTQIYASVWEALVLVLLLVLEKRKSLKASGSLFFIWLALHSVGRFGQEFFRADYRGPIWGGLTISMVLSVVLFVFALGKLAVLKRKRGSNVSHTF